jgi:hypothetical protein
MRTIIFKLAACAFKLRSVVDCRCFRLTIIGNLRFFPVSSRQAQDRRRQKMLLLGDVCSEGPYIT